MPEFAASPQPPIDCKQKCNERHDDEEGPVAHKQRLFGEDVQVPRYRGFIPASPHIDLHFPFTGRRQIEMRGVQRFVCCRFVACGKRELNDLGAARFGQVKKNFRVEDRALVAALLTKDTQVHAPYPDLGRITEECDEKRPSLLLQLNLAAIGPEKVRSSKEQKREGDSP
jgi:hypothetical protein